MLEPPQIGTRRMSGFAYYPTGQRTRVVELGSCFIGYGEIRRSAEKKHRSHIWDLELKLGSVNFAKLMKAWGPPLCTPLISGDTLAGTDLGYTLILGTSSRPFSAGS